MKYYKQINQNGTPVFVEVPKHELKKEFKAARMPTVNEIRGYMNGLQKKNFSLVEYTKWVIKQQ